MKKTKNKYLVWGAILGIVFVAEIFVMSFIHSLEITNEYLEVLLDAFLLALVISPLIYKILIQDIYLANLEHMQELERIKDAADDTVLISETDLSGKITYVNKKFCEVSGYEESELLGEDHRIVNSGHHPKSFWKKAWETIESGNVWTETVCNQAKDGSHYWVRTSIVPILDFKGEVKSYTSIRVDISEQVNLERKHLQAEKMALASAMIVTLNHEINNPLAIAKGFSKIIQRKHADDEDIKKLNQALDRIEDKVKKIDSITQSEKMELEDYSNSESSAKIIKIAK